MGTIIKKDNCFILNTDNTTYAFRVIAECGLLEHLYYGRKIKIESPDGLIEKHNFGPGNSIIYGTEDGQHVAMEDMCLEFSTYGRGDIREPILEVINKDGSSSLDFVYEGYEICDEKQALRTLPSSYGADNQLVILLRDYAGKLTAKITYSVFVKSNVITRSVELINDGDAPVKINRIMSNMLDLQGSGYKFTTFRGVWAREMKKYTDIANSGTYVNSSYTGTSSNRSNPFVMLSKKNTDEDNGECYGFNLIYSGNHYEAVDINAYNKTRFVQGINPRGFMWKLNPGESFEAPEAVMTFAKDGFNSLSRNMHLFVREHIVRGEYQHKTRPVLLNSWEASYFDINSSRLLKLAKAGKDVGIELFVMDDGWFGSRDDDTSSLGDWDVNEKKLPGGLKPLVDKIKALGLDFGIWVEPEMVNVKSKLYGEHPEWALDIPERVHSEGRNQRVLDLTRMDVQDFIIEKMSDLFNSADISYVKWDMNRILTDYYSKTLTSECQGEVSHRYVMGLYRVMHTLTERFPHILFEGCASGGNRFDLGILCDFPQIWASDDTDALCRAEIQNNYSYGYPQSTYTAHVSGVPNHQTLRITPIESRYNVASFGVLGYECNLCDLNKEELNLIKEQIVLYKENRELLQYGQMYRGRSFGMGDAVSDGSVLSDDAANLMEWTIVNEDKTKAVGVVMQKLVHPNSRFCCYFAKGLDDDLLYHVTTKREPVNIKEYGDLINTVAPIHIKKDSAIHELAAKFVKLNPANEDLSQYGDALMYGGLKLKEAFSGMGMNDDTRHFPDFSSIMIHMNSEM